MVLCWGHLGEAGTGWYCKGCKELVARLHFSVCMQACTDKVRLVCYVHRMQPDLSPAQVNHVWDTVRQCKMRAQAQALTLDSFNEPSSDGHKGK